MKDKLKSLVKSDFVKVSMWSGIATVVRMAIQLGTSKILAVFVGPSGFALVGQLQNGLTIFRTIASGAIANGVTKYVSEHNEDLVEQKKHINAAIRITMVCSILTSLVVILFSSFIASYLFDSKEYQSIIIYFGIGLGFFAFNGLLLAIINGLKRFKLFIIASLFGSFFTFIITFVLVYLLGLYGALLAFAIGQSLVFFVTVYMVRGDLESWFRGVWKDKLEQVYYSRFFRYSLMALTSAIVIPSSQILIRKFIITNLSTNDAGIWEGMNKISLSYLGIITMSLSTYYLPRLSEIKEYALLKNEVFKTIIIVFPISIVLGVTIYFLRDFVIQLLFTKDFLSMKVLFGPQMIGDSIKMMSWLLSFVMLAKAMTKLFIYSEIFFAISSVILSFIMIKKFGLIGSAYAYALNYFCYLLFLTFAFRKLRKI